MTKDVAIRALKTFWQSAIAYLVMSLSQGGDLFEVEVIGGLLIAPYTVGQAVWRAPRKRRLRILRRSTAKDIAHVFVVIIFKSRLCKGDLVQL